MLAESAQATIETPLNDATRKRLRSSIAFSRRSSIATKATISAAAPISEIEDLRRSPTPRRCRG